MPVLDLFDALVRERLIDPSQAESLRRRAQSAWQPLGKILRQRGHITMEQLIGLLDRQAREPAKRLGDLAVEAGYCTRVQLEECLATQRDSSPHPVEVLLSEHHLDPVRLLRALVPYLRQLEDVQSWSRND